MVTCGKCNAEIEGRRYMTCNCCSKAYDLDCANVSSPRLNLMTPTRKTSWICDSCWNKKSPSNLEIGSPDNITKRNTAVQVNVRTSNSFDGLSEDETLDSLNTSCPAKLDTQAEIIEMLKEKNASLQSELLSAEEEIQNLLSEKYALSDKISKLEFTIKNFSSICTSNKITSSQKKSKRKRTTLQKKVLDFGHDEEEDNINLSYRDLNISSVDSEKKNHQDGKVEQTVELTIQSDSSQSCPKPSPKKIAKKPIDSSKPYIDSMTTGKISDCTNNLWIFGTQKCSGLAAALIQARKNTKYEKYRVQNHVEPFAPSRRLLSKCRQLSLKGHDKIILCIGENDSNPIEMLNELRKLITLHLNFNIIILSVESNEYINVNKLNYEIDLLCKEFENCKFVKMTYRYNLNEMCKRLNIEIDFFDYHRKYLDVKQIKKIIIRKSSNLIQPKKGTIPFYFRKKCVDENDDKIFICGTCSSQKSQAKKGTIPYYFPPNPNKNCKTDSSNCVQQDKTETFFRK